MGKGSIEDGVVFHAGFPNAAEDGKFGGLSLDALVLRHRASTYYWQLEQDIPERQWFKGDTVVVDRALQPRDGMTVVVVSDDDFVLARLARQRFLHLDARKFDGDVTVWGVVTYVLHKL